MIVRAQLKMITRALVKMMVRTLVRVFRALFKMQIIGL